MKKDGKNKGWLEIVADVTALEALVHARREIERLDHDSRRETLVDEDRLVRLAGQFCLPKVMVKSRLRGVLRLTVGEILNVDGAQRLESE